MRIGLVLSEFDPRSGGGFTFQEALYTAVRALESSTAHEFVYYTGGAPAPGQARTVQLPLSRRSVAARAVVGAVRDLQDRALGVPRMIRPTTWFERSLRAESVDLVWFATPYAEDCDVPFLATVWDLAHLEHPWFPEVSAEGEWTRRQRHYGRYLPRAAAVIVPNHTGSEQVRRRFPVPEDRILELSFPTPTFALEAARAEPDPGRVRQLGIQEPYLFYPAQYWPHKNHAVLLEALRGMPDLTLVCVGSDKGGRRSVETRAAELGVRDRLRLLDFVETPDLVELYRNAWALAYPTYFGPENLPPLEAFALGCPVVASDIPGAREQYGDAALLAAPADAGAWVEAFERLRDRDLRARQVEWGRERAGARTARDYVDDVLARVDELAPVIGS